MFVHRFQDTREHKQELNILMRRLSRIKQVLTVVRRKRPVVMLTGTIHSRKWFFMQQALHPMLTCHPFQCLHDNMVMVDSHVRFRVDRRKFMLRRRHFIVLRLGSHADLPQLLIHILHEPCDSLADRSEIMIVQFLSLRRHSPE